MLLNIHSRYERMRCSRIKQHNCKSVVDEKYTNDNIRSFLGFLHSYMVDFPMSMVLLGSNRNKVGSMGRCGSMTTSGASWASSTATWLTFP
jgi:hypothetical protein